METMAARPIPAHVPPDMIGNFSLFSSPGLEPTPNGDPQAASAVVHDGALKDRGMASFAGSLSKDEIEAIRAYVIKRANEDKALEAGKKIARR